MRAAVRACFYALAVVGAAVALRWILDPLMGDALPLVTLFGAVAVAVWLSGYLAAALAAVAGYAACAWLFIEPRGHLAFERPNAVGFVAYLVTCSLIIGFGEAMRRAQGRAKERRELLRVTLQSIGDAVITTDAAGRITYLNPVAEAVTRWNNADAAGRPLEDVFRVVNEATRKPVENPAARALQEGVVVGLANHSILIARDGTDVPIDDSAAPIRNASGAIGGCVLVFRDVTDRRRGEHERASQLLAARLLASIVESSDDAIVRKSLDGVIESWNAAAERMFGWSADEAIGRHISLVIPPERRAEEDEIIASLKAGRRIDHFETERVRKDGRRILVSLTVSPVKDDSGRVVAASKIVRDVTERRKLEDAQRRLAAELAEADRRKDEFLAMLAHELRNPLAPISNAVQVLRRAGDDVTAVRAASQMLERQVAQMARLVDDLLDISRISHGRIELRHDRVDLADVVNQAVEAARPLIDSTGNALEVRLPSQPIVLTADAARLAQVVGNLLNNAAKFTNRGGRITVTAEREGSEAVVRVRDTGIGIEPEQLPRLFDMFAQVDATHERSRDGLGIGLTLVQKLVELHGGSVEARSEGLDRGAEFVVRLPVASSAAPRIAAPAAGASAAEGRRRVLVVDDNADGAESLALLVKLLGHESHVAHDGPEALDVAERMRPDVVLLDIGLPGMNGFEVSRALRSRPWGGTVQLVAVTGWGQEEDRRKSKEAGFDSHVVKPVELTTLRGLLSAPA